MGLGEVTKSELIRSDGRHSVNLGIDTSEMEGEYYLKIYMWAAGSNSGTNWLEGSFSIIGK